MSYLEPARQIHIFVCFVLFLHEIFALLFNSTKILVGVPRVSPALSLAHLTLQFLDGLLDLWRPYA